MDINFIGSLVLKFIIILLFGATYSYILKLEQTGCACAEHTSRNFIKKFSIFAIIYLLITMFIPNHFIINTFGSVIAVLYGLVQLVFIITAVVFFFLTLDYTRYLINEKCKCSEDIRREIIMIGSIIEIFLIVLLLLVLLILPMISAAIFVAFKNIGATETGLQDIISNPIGSLKTVPSNLKKTTQSLSNLVRSSAKGVKNIVTKKRSNILKK